MRTSTNHPKKTLEITEKWLKLVPDYTFMFMSMFKDINIKLGNK